MSSAVPSPQSTARLSSPKSAPRLGVFGGSFDPVHCGHLALARACQEQALLDEVWFTPTAIQPLKHGGPQASDEQRIEMLRLAIDPIDTGPREPGRPRPQLNWLVCSLEIERGGYSYTVDTLRQIHEELPEAKLFFLMGADSLRDVPTWKEPCEIFRLATPLVINRAGEPGPDLSAISPLCPPENQPQQIEMPPMDVSSTEIRRRIAAGQTLEGLVPAAVTDYINMHGLYR